MSQLSDNKIWEAPPILTDFEVLRRTPILFKKGPMAGERGYTDTDSIILLGKVLENLGETITGDMDDEELFHLLLELVP